MEYQDALRFLHEQLPMFHRIGPAAYKADLGTTVELAEILGNPQTKFRAVHIAGTNGKGSVSHMIASILQEAGYKTGLFTSPHLTDFRERIRINGEMIAEKYVCGFISGNIGTFSRLRPSFFEWTFGLMIDYFAAEGVDIAVVETGMGGRLDSTNIVNPLVSVITNIGYDHTHFLGNSLYQIAGEKAGIIKPGVPVVIGEEHPETSGVFVQKAVEANAPIHHAALIYDAVLTGNDDSCNHYSIFRNGIEVMSRLRCPLLGHYQRKNLTTVFMTAEVVAGKLTNMGEPAIKSGVEKVIVNTGIRGRWEIIGREPLVICDTAHNEDGIREVTEQLLSLDYDALHIVLGMLQDKDLEKILRLLPKNATYYFCRADIPRGLDAAVLMNLANTMGLNGRRHKSVIRAYQAALSSAGPSDLIFIGGSTFVVAEVIC